VGEHVINDGEHMSNTLGQHCRDGMADGSPPHADGIWVS
jgi:hypothetical protein